MNKDTLEKLWINAHSELQIEDIKYKYTIDYLELSQEISEIDSIILKFTDNNNTITTNLTNKKVNIHTEIPDKITDYPKPKREIYYEGYIENYDYEHFEEKNDKEKLYKLIIRPKFYKLNEGRRRKIYQNKSCIEIIEEILKENNFNDYKFNLKDKSFFKKLEYTTQYDESNLQFIQRLLENNRIFFINTYNMNEKKSEIIFSDNNTQFKEIEDSSFNLVYQFSAKDKFKELFIPITKNKIAINSILVNGYNYKIPKTKLTKQQKKEYSSLYSIYSEKFETINDVEYYLDTTLYSTTYDNLTYESFTRRTLDLGNKFTIKTKDYPDYNGEYIIFKKNVLFANEKVLSKIEFFSAKNHFAPKIKYRKPIVNGIQLGIVVGNKNDNVHVNKVGTIKVQFYWDQDHELNQESSNDIRVSQLFGGKSGGSGSMGAWFLPRVGQEVIVGFINGDPDQPIVLGCLYNGVNASPYEGKENSEGYTKSGIKTCSIPDGEKGHEFIFEDKKDEEKITISSSKDYEVLVANNSNFNIKKNSSIQIEEGDYSFEIKKGNRKILLKEGNYNIQIENGELVIETSKNITIKSKENINFSAEKNFEVSAENITLKAKSNIKSNASNTIEVEANSIKCKSALSSEFKAETSMQISGGTSTQLKAPSIGIESNLSFEMKGAIGKIEASGPLEIKGAITKLN